MQNQGGKKQYEFLVFMILVSIVSLVFYVWVERLSVSVERTRIQYTLANIRSAIKIRELTAIEAAKEYELVMLHHSNPMAFLTPPVEYIGEFDLPVSDASGRWFFDKQRQELAYGVISPESISQGEKQLRFRLDYMDESSANTSVGSLQLLAVPYLKENGIDD